jgi:hypothetical protein
MFFVSVASKGLRNAVSLLFATFARGSISVASKGLTLHKNCAILGDFLSVEWEPLKATEVATGVPRK